MTEHDRAMLLDLMQPYEKQHETARFRIVDEDPEASALGSGDELLITWVEPSGVCDEVVEVGPPPRALERARARTHGALLLACAVLLLLALQVLALFALS